MYSAQPMVDDKHMPKNIMCPKRTTHKQNTTLRNRNKKPTAQQVSTTANDLNHH